MILSLEDKDAAVIVLGLMLAESLLFKSRYPPEVRDELAKRIQRLVEEIQTLRQTPIVQDQQESEYRYPFERSDDQ